jgi:hypothetical protein
MNADQNSEIKIGENTFVFNMPVDLNNITTLDVLHDWCKLVEHQKTNQDEWVMLPGLPQYKFKNIKIESNLSENIEESTVENISFTCDDFELNDKKS